MASPSLSSDNSMEDFTRRIETAVASNDYGALSAVFSHGPQSFQSMGQGEQRSLAASFIKTAVSSKAFLPTAFSSAEAMGALETALSQLPPTVENAADSTLRQMLFDYKVNQEEDYTGAARILGGMRMEQAPESVYYMSPADITDGKLRIYCTVVVYGLHKLVTYSCSMRFPLLR